MYLNLETTNFDYFEFTIGNATTDQYFDYYTYNGGSWVNLVTVHVIVSAPKSNQTITFNNPGTKNFGTTQTLSASADSGLPVTFSSTTTGVCTVSGSTLTFVTAGTCTINANQAGNGSYNAATQVQQSFAVNAIAPGAPATPTATAGSTTASVSFTAPASTGGSAITSYTVTVVETGATFVAASSPISVTGLTNGTAYTFTVKATNVAGTGTASAASTAVTPKTAQTITFNNPGTQNFGTTPTLSASASSFYPVTFTSATTGVCTVSGSTLTFVTAGTCTINANQAGNSVFAAATQVQQSFTVNAVVPGAPAAPTATAGSTTASVSFSAPASNGGAAITGYTVTVVETGATFVGASSPISVTGLTNGTAYTFTVKATNSAGTGTASTASTAVTPKAAQTITFNNPGSQNFGTTPTLSASASSTLPVTFTSATTGVCTVSGTTLTLVTAGTCTINANQAGDAAFGAATQVQQTFAIAAVVPGVPTAASATAGNTSATVTFTAPAFTGGAAITGYTVTVSPGGATFSGATSPINVTGLINGTTYTFTVKATNSAGNGTASTATNAVTPLALPGAPTGVSATAGDTTASVSFSAPASNGGAAITGYTVTASPGGATATGTSSPISVTGLTNGTAYTFTVTATNTAGTGTASTASTAVTPKTVPGAPSGVSATAGDTTASVSFTAPASNGGATITGYTVTVSPGGATFSGAASPINVSGLTNGSAYTFTVTATNSSGTSLTSGASAAVTPKGNQTISFTNPGSQNFGSTPTLSASASSTLPVTFTSATTGVCTVSGTTLTLVTAGTCTIEANQAGNGSYNAAAQVQRTFAVAAVVPGAPTGATATVGNTSASVAFTAPASNGGAAITGYTVTVVETGATFSGAASPINVTGLTNGTAYTFTVKATNSAGTGAASSASAAVTPQVVQTITFNNPGSQNFGTTPTLTASASSGLSVSFTSATPAVCTISGNTLNLVSAGNCTINANQAGNASYNAAAQVQQTFAITAVVAGAPTAVSATAGNAAATVTFTAPVFTGGAAITGYTVTVVETGATFTAAASPINVTGLTNGTAYTFTVKATNSAGSSSASAASGAITPKASQTISFTAPANGVVGGVVNVTATASSGLPVSFSSVTLPVCTVTGSSVNLIAAGTCTINADQSGNASFTAASQVSRSFTVGSMPVPVLSFAQAGPVQITLGNSLNNAVTSTLSGGSYGAISYSSSNAAVATVDATGKVTPVAAGSVVITATQAAVTGINAQAVASYSLTVGKNAQAALTLTADKLAIFKVTGKATLTASGGSGSGAVSFAISSGACSLSGNVLSAGSTAGNCVVTATKDADANFSAVSASLTIQIQNLTAASVTIGTTQSQVLDGVPVTLTAAVTPAASTGTISFMDGSVNLATVTLTNGSALLVAKNLAVGVHTITAVYSGDAVTAPGNSVAITVTVGKRPDPAVDPVVKNTAVAAANISQRFTQAQMTNIYSHVQVLHHDFSIKNRFGISFSAPGLDMFRMAANKISENLTANKDSFGNDLYRLNPADVRLAKAPFAKDEAVHKLTDSEEEEAPKNDEWFQIAGKPVGMWTAGNIDFGGIDAADGSRTKFSSSGLTIGMDMMWNPKLIVGLSVGYARDKATMDNFGSESKSKQWSGMLYGTYKPEKEWFIDGMGGIGKVNYDNHRWDDVNSQLLAGERTGQVSFMSLTLTRDLKVAKDLHIQPFGRFDVLHTKLDAYTERGSVLALTLNNTSSVTTAFTGGLNFAKDFYLDFGQITPSLKLQWRHRTSGEMNQSMYYTDLGAGSTNYNVLVVGLPEDIQSVGLGLNVKSRRGITTNFSWLGSMGAHTYRANSFRVDFRLGF
ncbi:fibronectin type III domain-containing protein [Undibacterium crateris]|uniref:fibronectin type III domain-containing protein n=1 Tax=Undibacterium crateris TaxID=2528175 RepID=UPI00138A5E02|nr:fibronectin type III domain-containing protein [Undibacterium crateris]NDI85202.1 autotransporter domain-containing protein [Undibacterium crateris]